eukprot:1162051-Pelagomonas_calceolata.AAC.21
MAAICVQQTEGARKVSADKCIDEISFSHTESMRKVETLAGLWQQFMYCDAMMMDLVNEQRGMEHTCTARMHMGMDISLDQSIIILNNWSLSTKLSHTEIRPVPHPNWAQAAQALQGVPTSPPKIKKARMRPGC